MNIQKNFAVVCAALAALPTAFAETASVERDAAALAKRLCLVLAYYIEDN